MTKTEFNRAFTLAHDDSIDWHKVDQSHLFGCGLPDFQITPTTILPVAALIRWQAMYYIVPKDCPDVWDNEELKQLRRIARYKFELIGPGSDEVVERKKNASDVLSLLEHLCK